MAGSLRWRRRSGAAPIWMQLLLVTSACRFEDNFFVHVTDPSGTPLPGALVTVSLDQAYDQFSTWCEITGEDGIAGFDLGCFGIDECYNEVTAVRARKAGYYGSGQSFPTTRAPERLDLVLEPCAGETRCSDPSLPATPLEAARAGCDQLGDLRFYRSYPQAGGAQCGDYECGVRDTCLDSAEGLCQAGIST
jgi:hypothetical protein